MTTATPDLASITSVEDLTPLITAADERRRGLLHGQAPDFAAYTRIAAVCDELAAIYVRATTLSAISHPPCVHYAARDAAQHWATQAALFRKSAREADAEEARR